MNARVCACMRAFVIVFMRECVLECVSLNVRMCTH